MSGAVAVVGAGLIGTSLALALRAGGTRVLLYDSDPAHVEAAVAAGAGDPGSGGSDSGSGASPTGALEGDVELVVVAVPPSAVAAEVAAAMVRFPSATVTDVASVKAPVVGSLRASGVDLERFVGGHPMAGRETSGPEAASADLFLGRIWILTPEPETAAARVAQVAAMAERAGAVVRTMTPAEHDSAVALTSHTPQLVSSAMAARLAESDPTLIALAGQGLRDVVRIAHSDPVLWTDILAANAAEVTPVLSAVRDDLDRVLAALAVDDADDADDAEGFRLDRGRALVDILAAGNIGAARLPAKHGGEAAVYTEVPVEVADSPGALGRLFLVAGDAGINLEDVRIEHTVGRLTAIAHLYVLPTVAPALREALLADGRRVLD